MHGQRLNIKKNLMPDTKLKPCPFCGTVPHIKETGNIGMFVCRGPACFGSGMWTGFILEDKESAIKTWNTRSLDPDSNIDAAIELLRQETSRDYTKNQITIFKKIIADLLYIQEKF